MKDAPTDSLEQLGYEELASNGRLRVAISPHALKCWKSLEDNVVGRFRRIMEQWCEQRKLLPKMHNKNEGRTNRFNLRVEAFKSFKVRFYGYDREVDGKRTLLIADSDPAKKQDKADPTILKRSKDRIDDLEEKLRRIENERNEKKGAKHEQRRSKH